MKQSTYAGAYYRTVFDSDGSNPEFVSDYVSSDDCFFTVEQAYFYSFVEGINPSPFSRFDEAWLSNSNKLSGLSIIVIYKLHDVSNGKYALMVQPVGTDHFLTNYDKQNPDRMLIVSKGNKQTTYLAPSHLYNQATLGQNVQFMFWNIPDTAFTKRPRNSNSEISSRATVMHGYSKGHYSKESNPMFRVNWKAGITTRIMVK
jgi:hypothetical protein